MSTYYNPIRDSMMSMTMSPPTRVGTVGPVSSIPANATLSSSSAASHTHENASLATSPAANTSLSLDSSKKKLLSTSSPEGIQVASKITATRLANLLIRKGPLPIRHITSQLAIEVPSFDLLSLSKQRRLIMSAMEQKDVANKVVFEKIGWGQWAVRKMDSDFIVTEGTESTLDLNSSQNPQDKLPQINVNDLRNNQANVKLGWSKKSKLRRESITNNKTNLHNLKLPNEALAENSDSVAIASDSEDESSDEIVEDEKEDDEDDDDDDDEDDDELFAFDDDPINKFKKSSPPIKFAKRVPIKLSPPPAEIPSRTNRRRSSSSNQTNSSINKSSGYRNLLINRSRLNSIDNLDNYVKSSAKNSNMSISSPPIASQTLTLQFQQYQFQQHPLAAAQPNQYYNSSGSASALSVSPPTWNGNGNNYVHHSGATTNATSTDSIAATLNGSGNRRKSSFNESHLRSTLSSSLPKAQQQMSSPHAASQLLNIANLLNKPYDNAQHANSTPSITEQLAKVHGLGYSDTDEEDWATIGPESLRRQQKLMQLQQQQQQQQQQQLQQQQQQQQQQFHQQQIHQLLQQQLQQQQTNGHASLLSKSITPRSPILKLRRSSHSHSRSRSIAMNVNSFDLNDEEKSAAFALVDLRSI